MLHCRNVARDDTVDHFLVAGVQVEYGRDNWISGYPAGKGLRSGGVSLAPIGPYSGKQLACIAAVLLAFCRVPTHRIIVRSQPSEWS